MNIPWEHRQQVFEVDLFGTTYLIAANSLGGAEQVTKEIQREFPESHPLQTAAITKISAIGRLANVSVTEQPLAHHRPNDLGGHPI